MYSYVKFVCIKIKKEMAQKSAPSLTFFKTWYCCVFLSKMEKNIAFLILNWLYLVQKNNIETLTC
jgi:hypothetical protein